MIDQLANTLTLRTAFEQFKLPEMNNPRSAQDVLHTLNRWELWTDNPAVGEITKQTLLRFREASVAAGNRPATTNKHVRNVKTILRRLGPEHYRNPDGEGIISRVPHVKALPVEHQPPRVIPLDVLSDLFDAAAETTWPEDVLPPAEFWRALLLLGYNTALRRGDLLRLSGENIDLEKRLLTIRAGKTKKQQLIPLNEIALAAVRRIWSPRSLLFGKTVVRKQFYHEWKRLQAAAGIEGAERFHFHDIRRTGLTAYESVKPGTSSYLGGHLPQSQLNGMATMRVTREFYVSAPQVIFDAAEMLPQPEAFKSILDGPQQSLIKLANSTRRSDWKFGVEWAEFRGTRFHLASRPLRVLRSLVHAGKPLSFQDLREAAFWDDPNISDNTIKGAVHRCRQSLVNSLDLPGHFDPIKANPTEGTWLLRIY